jgi:triosephosphate isomerase
MLIAGNWKMNGLGRSLAEARALSQALTAAPSAARVALCPPATLIARLAAEVAGGPIEVGGQDCRAEPEGAFTGDVSPEMLVDCGASLVILGHSERRAGHCETDSVVFHKVEGALRAGLEPIVCVGETLAQRRAGDAVTVVIGQVDASLPDALRAKAFAVAYEPVWAIGSGVTPTPIEIEQIHAAIRGVLIHRFGSAGAAVPILYGGSVKSSNAAEILRLPEVGGALVGGASLKASDFEPIIRAA